MHLTVKQIELLTIIREGNPGGSLVDLDQLIERASYGPSKQSIQFSVRALIAKGLMEKAGPENRRGRSRVLFRITPAGEQLVRPAFSGPRSIVLSVEEDALLSEIEGL